MATEFDWSLVSQAAEKWMAENPETLPKWLVLPSNTPDAIVDMAQEIYDVPTVLDDIEVPWFTTIAPAPPAPPKPDRLDPMDVPVSGGNFHRQRLLEAARQGTLTAEDIQKMSMEEYALVRGLLLNQVRNQGLKGVRKL